MRTMKSVILNRKFSPALTSTMMNKRVKTHDTLDTEYGNILSSPNAFKCLEAARNAGVKVVIVAIKNATMRKNNPGYP